MSQLSEAEQKVVENSSEAQACVENARRLAAESLVEARRTISALHTTAAEPQGTEG
jgi:signal transduction histidine kinase